MKLGGRVVYWLEDFIVQLAAGFKQRLYTSTADERLSDGHRKNGPSKSFNRSSSHSPSKL
jgi:hypothetical protein